MNGNHRTTTQELLRKLSEIDETKMSEDQLPPDSPERKRRINQRIYQMLLAECEREREIIQFIISYYIALLQKERDESKKERSSEMVFPLEREQQYDTSEKLAKYESMLDEIDNQIYSLKQEIVQLNSEITNHKSDYENLRVKGLETWIKYYSSDDSTAKYIPIKIKISLPDEYKDSKKAGSASEYVEIEIDKDTYKKYALLIGEQVYKKGEDISIAKVLDQQHETSNIIRDKIKHGLARASLSADAYETIMKYKDNSANAKNADLMLINDLFINSTNHKAIKQNIDEAVAVKVEIDTKELAVKACEEKISILEAKKSEIEKLRNELTNKNPSYTTEEKVNIEAEIPQNENPTNIAARDTTNIFNDTQSLNHEMIDFLKVGADTIIDSSRSAVIEKVESLENINPADKKSSISAFDEFEAMLEEETSSKLSGLANDCDQKFGSSKEQTDQMAPVDEPEDTSSLSRGP